MADIMSSFLKCLSRDFDDSDFFGSPKQTPSVYLTSGAGNCVQEYKHFVGASFQYYYDTNRGQGGKVQE
jgi:hypothetical protein